MTWRPSHETARVARQAAERLFRGVVAASSVVSTGIDEVDGSDPIDAVAADAGPGLPDAVAE